jgi:hypothetical protein
MVFKIGKRYRTIDGHKATVLAKCRRAHGIRELVIKIELADIDHILCVPEDGINRPRMMCNYVSDGPCAYDLTTEEWK